MKRKTKKILALSGTGLTAATVTAIGVGIYFSTPEITRVSEKDLYVIRLNIKPELGGYRYDSSHNSGPKIPLSATSLVTGELIHLKTEGKLLIESQPDGTNKITPSYESYQFGLADAIVAVLQNKNDPSDKIELVFDSDEADFPDVPANNEQIALVKNSTNRRSINNQDIFLNLLATGAINGKVNSVEQLNKSAITKNGNYVLTKLGFTVKENVPWVDANGQSTQYRLKAADFWYSFMRSKLFDRDYRRANGGSKALDDFFIEKTSAATSFQETMQFTNEYLFNFFDLDSTKLYERKDAIQAVTINNQKREMFTFTSLDQAKATNGFLAVLKKLLSNNLLFAAAPSDFIKDLTVKPELHENLGPNKNLNITAKARQFGTYTYG